MQLASVGTKSLTWRVGGVLPGVSLDLGPRHIYHKELERHSTQRTEHAKARGKCGVGEYEGHSAAEAESLDWRMGEVHEGSLRSD